MGFPLPPSEFFLSSYSVNLSTRHALARLPSYRLIDHRKPFFAISDRDRIAQPAQRQRALVLCARRQIGRGSSTRIPISIVKPIRPEETRGARALACLLTSPPWRMNETLPWRNSSKTWRVQRKPETMRTH